MNANDLLTLGLGLTAPWGKSSARRWILRRSRVSCVLISKPNGDRFTLVRGAAHLVRPMISKNTLGDISTFPTPLPDHGQCPARQV